MHDVMFWVCMEVMFVPSLSCPQWMSKLIFPDEYVLFDGQSASMRSNDVMATECIMPSFVGGVLMTLSEKPVLGQQFAKPIS